MKERLALMGTLMLLSTLVIQPAPANADDEIASFASGVAGDCSAYGRGGIPPTSSLNISFTCPSPSTVYFGVCDSGSRPNDDLFNITYQGSVVAHNEYVNGSERTHIGQASVSTGAHNATLNSLNSTPYPPATYSYAISPDRAQVDDYLKAWCGNPHGQRTHQGSIRGMVFHDTNRNGVRDVGERGIEGTRVTLYSSGPWQHTFTTGDDGTYAPVALNSSYYAVEITVPQGYVATGLTRYEGIEVDGAAGTVVLGVDFGIAPAAAPSDPQSSTPNTYAVHVVRRGEWLYKIARIYNVNVWTIINANSLSSLQLVPGQVLIIPGTAFTPSAPAGCRSTYIVRPGDNLFRISLRFHVSMLGLAARNDIRFPYTVYAGQTLCIP